MELSPSKLRHGYTTGTHTTAIVQSALVKYIGDIDLYKCPVVLPDGDIAEIIVEDILVTAGVIRTSTIKTNNDDFDVTKGARLICYLADQKDLLENKINSIDHQPCIIEIDKFNMLIYAGYGVGIVTKRGLKAEIGYPAINPVPLKMIERAVQDAVHNENLERSLYCVIQIENGAIIAKDTTNEKVGVLGGLSILGTKGIVKPVSASAYIDSIEAEIGVANASGSNAIVFTLGNTSLSFAKSYINVQEECYIEIGNFIYESIKRLIDTSFTEVYFVANIGKMTKLAQGFKNTHNKHGWINFNDVIGWILEQKDELKGKIHGKDFSTMKELELTLLDFDETGGYKNLLHEILTEKAVTTLVDWIHSFKKEKNMVLTKAHTVTTDGKKRTYHASFDII
ncbi:MAG: cobalt-precorrin-5B C(1)-methyltransferase [bacterium]|nr:MAG: cobalt-precorrin-5B C(1)-methyltransferase [bacterium]